MLTNLMALQQGADILRVHDVKAAADVVAIYNA
jgi:dihydropteroate synthase